MNFRRRSSRITPSAGRSKLAALAFLCSSSMRLSLPVTSSAFPFSQYAPLKTATATTMMPRIRATPHPIAIFPPVVTENLQS